MLYNTTAPLPVSTGWNGICFRFLLPFLHTRLDAWSTNSSVEIVALGESARIESGKKRTVSRAGGN
jgi:hypothetical protein